MLAGELTLVELAIDKFFGKESLQVLHSKGVTTWYRHEM